MPKNTLSNQFKAVFSEELKHHGFLLHKKTFYRIINDVVQTLMLNKTSTNFTLEFSILPLCLPIIDLFCEGYDISIQGKRGWWDCLGEINEDIFSEAMFLFSQNVMPIFTRGIHSESAYSELINYEKMVYSEMPEGVYLRGYSFVMMCISYGNYKMAHNHLSVIVNRWDQAYKKKLPEIESQGGCQEKNWAFEKTHDEMQMLKNMLYKLSIPDVDYFSDLVAQNEALSLSYLKQPSKRK